MLQKAGAEQRPQSVHSAMHICVVAFVIVPQSLENRHRFLRCGGIVKVDQLIPVHLLHKKTAKLTTLEINPNLSSTEMDNNSLASRIELMLSEEILIQLSIPISLLDHALAIFRKKNELFHRERKIQAPTWSSIGKPHFEISPREGAQKTAKLTTLVINPNLSSTEMGNNSLAS